MEKSESIKELSAALCEAQKNNNLIAESNLIKKLLNKKFNSNQYIKKNRLDDFMSKVAFGMSDCWIWIAGKNNGGYGVVIKSTGQSKAHRLSYNLFKGEIPNGLSVLHKCDNPSCVNPDHLFTGTQDENMKDCSRKGRIKNTPLSGERNPMSKLTNKQVLKIRSLHMEISQAKIARMFSVSPMTINRIVRRQLWTRI